VHVQLPVGIHLKLKFRLSVAAYLSCVLDSSDRRNVEIPNQSSSEHYSKRFRWSFPP